jgi:hypothetical protein
MVETIVRKEIAAESEESAPRTHDPTREEKRKAVEALTPERSRELFKKYGF